MKDGEIVQIGTPEEIMMSPANEFVEKFVADVNLGKVITAESILKRPETLLIDRGPRVALQIMRNAGVSTVYVVNKKYEFLGILTADDASKAVQNSGRLLIYYLMIFRMCIWILYWKRHMQNGRDEISVTSNR